MLIYSVVEHGTGKTSTARIIGSMLNEGRSNAIELNCADKNGVEDMRSILNECSTRPIIGKYKIFIMDECHQLSTSAWNALLKVLEEPPEYVIFLFCTTDPQKIIGTILSRVQRFNFSRISTEGIIKRLTFILQQENITTYEPSAIEYIARLAKGGMRDSITTLEKCLDYNSNLTLQNVQVVTSGGVNELTLFDFMKYLLNRDAKSSLQCFNKIYMTGVDTVLFLKLYTEFIENCIKYIITQESGIVTLSDIVISWLNQNTNFLDDIRDQLLSVINIKTGYSNEDLRIIIESWIIHVCNL